MGWIESMNMNIFLLLRFSSLNNFHRRARKNVQLAENQIYKTHLRFRPFSLISHDQRKKHCEHSVWLFFETTPLTLTAIDVNPMPYIFLYLLQDKRGLVRWLISFVPWRHPARPVIVLTQIDIIAQSKKRFALDTCTVPTCRCICC